MVDRKSYRLARELQEREGIKYTQALRRVLGDNGAGTGHGGNGDAGDGSGGGCDAGAGTNASGRS